MSDTAFEDSVMRELRKIRRQLDQLERDIRTIKSSV